MHRLMLEIITENKLITKKMGRYRNRQLYLISEVKKEKKKTKKKNKYVIDNILVIILALT